MRSPHLLLTAALRGVAGRFGHGRDREVALEGHGYARPRGPVDRCRVEGCGARATRVVLRSDGSQIAVCARCGEELEAILGTISVSGHPLD